jgi:iron(III) transport system permease protein
VILMALVLAAFFRAELDRDAALLHRADRQARERSTRPSWALARPVLGLFALVAMIGVVIPLAAIVADLFMGTISGGLSWDNFELAPL